ncbi:MAG: SRPBCC family protein [Phycisphaeraceae bacterium]
MSASNRPEISLEVGQPAPRRKRWLRVLTATVVVVGTLVAIFSLIVAMQPAGFTITRSTSIAAPPAVVFAHVNDFRNWRAWSPWEGMDPQLQRTYEGEAAGKGAVYAWAGNKDVGEGHMTIVGSDPPELILIRVKFVKPFEATNLTVFTFKPQGDQTLVTWTMAGKNNFVGKTVCLFMDMNDMVGGQFEKGLAQMKAVAEVAPAN